MRTTTLAMLALLALTLSVGGCRRNVDLAGTDWQLISLDGASPIEGSTITLSFADGRAAGNAGCNRYFGSCEVEGKSLTIGALGSTKMACHDPEGVMNQEQRYLELLGAAERYEARDGELRITSAEGLELVFKAQE